MRTQPILNGTSNTQDTTTTVGSGSQQTVSAEATTPELYKQIRTLADRAILRSLNDQAINAIWKERDKKRKMTLTSTQLLEKECCNVFALTKGPSSAMSRCTENNLNKLLSLLRDNSTKKENDFLGSSPDFKEKIKQFTKEEWLLTILDSKSSTPLGKLLREPKVFNYLYTYIDINTRPQRINLSESEFPFVIAKPPVQKLPDLRTKEQKEEDKYILGVYEKLRGKSVQTREPIKLRTLLTRILNSVNKLGKKVQQIQQQLGINDGAVQPTPPKKANQVNETQSTSRSKR